MLGLVDPLVVKNTRFSEDRKHRYTLFRHWGDPSHFCAFVGMNPSGADEAEIDRTVNRCIEFAKDWGYGAFYMLNAFSLRETDSAALIKSNDRVRSKNDFWIKKIASTAPRVVAAWGKRGATGGRGEEVEEILLNTCESHRVFCFGRNKDGSPKHPLYQPKDSPLVPFLHLQS